MSMVLQEQARQSGLFVSDETAEWNEADWPRLECDGWQQYHATVDLNHPDMDDTDNTRGQTVVLLGGHQNPGTTNSVLVLNLAESNKQWRRGPPMNQKRQNHAAVVCNGGVYVMGGHYGADLDCMERIDINDLLQSSSTPSSTHESHWTTLNCRLLTRRCGCSAVAVQNRYIVAMGGWNRLEALSSVDIIDTNHHTVVAGPPMTVPRSYCGSAVIGHRIFVAGGCTTNTSVEYLDFTTASENEESNDDSLSTVISFSSAWKTTHSDLVLSHPRHSCTMVAVGYCLVVARGESPTVQVLNTHRYRMWNLPPFGTYRHCSSMVTFANQVAVIGENPDPTCATLPLMDKNTWCFCRLCEQQCNERYHSLEGSGAQDVHVTGSMRNANVRPCLTSTLPRKRACPNTP